MLGRKTERVIGEKRRGEERREGIKRIETHESNMDPITVPCPIWNLGESFAR